MNMKHLLFLLLFIILFSSVFSANLIQIRRDTNSNWGTANPVLSQGEMGLNLTTLQIKFGDGVTNWNDLNYYSTGSVDLSGYVQKNDYNTYGDARYYLKTNPSNYISSYTDTNCAVLHSCSNVLYNGDLSGDYVKVGDSNLTNYYTKSQSDTNWNKYFLLTNVQNWMTKSLIDGNGYLTWSLVDGNFKTWLDGNLNSYVKQSDGNSWYWKKTDLTFPLTDANISDLNWGKITNPPWLTTYTDTNTSTKCGDNNSFVLGTGACITYNYPVTYYPSSILVSGGTIVDNNVLLAKYYDNSSFVVNEGNGANANDNNFYFTGVNTVDTLNFRAWYNGTHTYEVDLWDYPTKSWQQYYDFTSSAGYNVITIPIDDSQSHVSSGNAIVRFHHIQNGVSSQSISYDYVWLTYAINSSTNIDLNGYAKYSYAGNNFSGTGSFVTTSDVNGGKIYQGVNGVCDASNNCGYQPTGSYVRYTDSNLASYYTQSQSDNNWAKYLLLTGVGNWMTKSMIDGNGYLTWSLVDGNVKTWLDGNLASYNTGTQTDANLVAYTYTKAQQDVNWAKYLLLTGVGNWMTKSMIDGNGYLTWSLVDGNFKTWLDGNLSNYVTMSFVDGNVKTWMDGNLTLYPTIATMDSNVHAWMDGNLTLYPTIATMDSNVKAWMDGNIATTLLKSGGAMTGDLNFNGENGYDANSLRVKNSSSYGVIDNNGSCMRLTSNGTTVYIGC